jgi:hypothetical protein
MANEPIAPPAVLGIFFHSKPLIKKPINGNNGTK